MSLARSSVIRRMRGSINMKWLILDCSLLSHLLLVVFGVGSSQRGSPVGKGQSFLFKGEHVSGATFGQDSLSGAGRVSSSKTGHTEKHTTSTPSTDRQGTSTTSMTIRDMSPQSTMAEQMMEDPWEVVGDKVKGELTPSTRASSISPFTSITLASSPTSPSFRALINPSSTLMPAGSTPAGSSTLSSSPFSARSIPQVDFETLGSSEPIRLTDTEFHILLTLLDASPLEEADRRSHRTLFDFECLDCLEPIVKNKGAIIAKLNNLETKLQTQHKAKLQTQHETRSQQRHKQSKIQSEHMSTMNIEGQKHMDTEGEYTKTPENLSGTANLRAIIERDDFAKLFKPFSQECERRLDLLKRIVDGGWKKTSLAFEIREYLNGNRGGLSNVGVLPPYYIILRLKAYLHGRMFSTKDVVGPATWRNIDGMRTHSEENDEGQEMYDETNRPGKLKWSEPEEGSEDDWIVTVLPEDETGALPDLEAASDIFFRPRASPHTRALISALVGIGVDFNKHLSLVDHVLMEDVSEDPIDQKAAQEAATSISSRPSFVRALIEDGKMNVNGVMDVEGRMVVHSLAADGRMDANGVGGVNARLDHIMVVAGMSPIMPFEMVMLDRENPIGVAVRLGMVEYVKVLLECGASPNVLVRPAVQKQSFYCYTPSFGNPVAVGIPEGMIPDGIAAGIAAFSSGNPLAATVAYMQIDERINPDFYSEKRVPIFKLLIQYGALSDQIFNPCQNKNTKDHSKYQRSTPSNSGSDASGITGKEVKTEDQLNVWVKQKYLALLREYFPTHPDLLVDRDMGPDLQPVDCQSNLNMGLSREREMSPTPSEGSITSFVDLTVDRVAIIPEGRERCTNVDSSKILCVASDISSVSVSDSSSMDGIMDSKQENSDADWLLP